jgi:hypothetical protein
MNYHLIISYTWNEYQMKMYNSFGAATVNVYTFVFHVFMFEKNI